eukprot:31434-Pelagococcus_subviridis.AAC.19
MIPNAHRARGGGGAEGARRRRRRAFVAASHPIRTLSRRARPPLELLLRLIPPTRDLPRELILDALVVRHRPLHLSLPQHQTLHLSRRDDARGSSRSDPFLSRRHRHQRRAPRRRRVLRRRRGRVLLALRALRTRRTLLVPNPAAAALRRRGLAPGLGAVRSQHPRADAHLADEFPGFSRRHLDVLSEGVFHEDVHGPALDEEHVHRALTLFDEVVSLRVLLRRELHPFREVSQLVFDAQRRGFDVFDVFHPRVVQRRLRRHAVFRSQSEARDDEVLRVLRDRVPLVAVEPEVVLLDASVLERFLPQVSRHRSGDDDVADDAEAPHIHRGAVGFLLDNLRGGVHRRPDRAVVHALRVRERSGVVLKPAPFREPARGGRAT